MKQLAFILTFVVLSLHASAQNVGLYSSTNVSDHQKSINGNDRVYRHYWSNYVPSKQESKLELVKHYQLEGDSARVASILTNLEQYGEFHPLIKAVEIVSTDACGNIEYKIIERPYRWLPIRISYRAVVHKGYNNILYVISGIPLTDSTIEYEIISKSNDELDVKFHLVIEGKAIGKKILMKKMSKAQDQLMDAINQEYAMQN